MAKKKIWMILCITTAICLAGCSKEGQKNTGETEKIQAAEPEEGEEQEDGSITGRVTAVNGNEITLALVEMPQMGEGGPGGDGQQPPEGETMAEGEEPPERPEGGMMAEGEEPSERPEGETMAEGEEPPERPEGETVAEGEEPPERPEGEMMAEGKETPAMPEGGNGGGPGGINTTGEEQTITVSEETVYTIDEMGESREASLEDIEEGSLLRVEMDGDTAVSITIMNMNMEQGGPGNGGMSGSSTGSITLEGVYTVNGTEESREDADYTSTAGDENAVLVTNGGKLSLTGGTLAKSGDTSSDDESNFYGVNAIFTAAAGGTADLEDMTLTSDGEGANAIFATGEGAEITVKNVTIETTGNSSRGLDATYGGKVTAADVKITTQGAHCAPVATDRGEGTIEVTGAVLSASGDGSPCIYSTGNITARDVTGTAADSQAAVVEGKNSITLENCNLTGAGENGVMLYQSTSGDAAEGTAVFTVSDSTLSVTSDGPMFYVTNTEAEAFLENTVLDFSSGILAKVSGNNTNNWGKEGENGGAFTLTGKNQSLEGDITCDEISTVSLALTEGTSYQGAVDSENTGKEVRVSLDADSRWEVTEDSYVDVLLNEIQDCSNISSDGYTIYYDAEQEENAWLGGETIELDGGGTLTPAEE